jgi:hypothetical protein
VPIPPRPERPDTKQPAGSSWLSIQLALILLSVLSVGFFLLTGGMFAWVFAVGGVFFVMTVLHYLVWGWWLGKMIRDEADEEELG